MNRKKTTLQVEEINNRLRMLNVELGRPKKVKFFCYSLSSSSFPNIGVLCGNYAMLSYAFRIFSCHRLFPEKFLLGVLVFVVLKFSSFYGVYHFSSCVYSSQYRLIRHSVHP